ncbi:MAG: alanine/glycine:cation symporter family protein [Brumimicrobium sp.]
MILNYKHFILILFLIFSAESFSQDTRLQAELHLKNNSAAINDVTAEIQIKGGRSPLIFLWNQQNVSIYHKSASSLSEGTEISVLVIDANKDSVHLTGSVPVSSFEEKIGSFIRPSVNVLKNILFKKIWSDTLKVDKFSLKAPFSFDREKENYTFKKWTRSDGDFVNHLDVVAILQEGENEIPLYAIGSGILKHGVFENKKVEQGDLIYYTNSRGNRSLKELGAIEYESPQPFYNQNLTFQIQGFPLIVAWLIFGAIFFTFKMKFIQFNPKIIKHAIDLIRGKYDKPTEKGEVSHFQALVTALSATIGLGNIAGVAIAIGIGGPGATFWMILAGLLGMVVKFSEATLGVKYRVQNKDGEVSGGPMYYLSRGLAKRGGSLKIFGKLLAMAFAILCVIGSFGIGNMFQANQAFDQLSKTPGFEFLSQNGFYFGIGLAIIVGLVIIGGIKSIARVTDKIVPLMVAVYVISALAIIAINYNNLGSGLLAIINGAFNPDSVYGGIIGVLIIGFQRAAFSNEAGIGSSPIAHSAAKTEEPVSEGIVALLEPLIDTVLVCTMTSFVIVFSGYAIDNEGLEGVALTSAAFSSFLGSWAIYVLTFSVFLFSFSTMISWSYYGKKAFTYLFGKNKIIGNVYNLIFLIFIVIGTSIGLGDILDFSDLLILAMAFPNILGLIIMSGEIKKDFKEYFRKITSGEIIKRR